MTLDMSRFIQYVESAPDKCEMILQETAFEIEAQAKINASDVPPGPHVDTGALMNSIQTVQNAPLSRDVGTPLQYGPYVEFGTSHNAAYPFLIPAYIQKAPDLVKKCKKAFQP